jgi:hypothetical protein
MNRFLLKMSTMLIIRTVVNKLRAFRWLSNGVAKRLFLLFVFICLWACGGGTFVTSPPLLNIKAQGIKTLQFYWPAVSDAQEYRLLEDTSGSGDFTQIATLNAGITNYDYSLPSISARVNARYRLQSCNRAGCSNSRTDVSAIPALNQAIGYIKASNTDANDRFGWSVAISSDGNTLAVGAYDEDSDATGGNNATSNSGAVYIFGRSGNAWVQEALIKASNTDADDRFGWSVALSGDGNILAVGAPNEDSNAKGTIGADQINNLAPNAGATYIYSRNGSTWLQQAYIKASNTDAGDFFGAALALSIDGTTLAVGAYGEGSITTGTSGSGQTDNSAPNSGAAYVFIRSGNNWTQQAYIKASNTDAGDQFGWALALSGDGAMLAVGAYNEDSNATGTSGSGQANNSAENSGAVYVFTLSGTGWSQQTYIKASNTEKNDVFGISVALSADANTLAVGAYGEASNATGTSGSGQSDNSKAFAGSVYIFARSGTSWSQQAYIKAFNTDVLYYFGAAVALSADGTTLAVGAYGETSNAKGIGGIQSDLAIYAGAVYVYTRSNGTWNPQSYLKAPNSDENDNFGSALALSSNALTLAVGAYGESSSAKGTTNAEGLQSNNSATKAGAIYIY